MVLLCRAPPASAKQSGCAQGSCSGVWQTDQAPGRGLRSRGLRSRHAAAASSEQARLLELFELQAAEGPCLDAYSTGTRVSEPDLASDTRWPRFSPIAIGSGFAAVDALPLRLRGHRLGALNLFQTRPGGLDESTIRIGQGLADVATIAILAQRAVDSGALLTEQLQSALNSRVILEQAKGVLAERGGLAIDEVFAVLRGYARTHNLSLTNLARDVVDGSADLDAVLRLADVSAVAARPQNARSHIFGGDVLHARQNLPMD